MNHYGQMAKDHWERWLPSRYAEIPDPEYYFRSLGEQVTNQIAELWPQLAGDDPPYEGYLDKVGRLNAAKQQAEEIVLREEVPLEPEPGADPDEMEELDEQEETSLAKSQDSGWIPVIEDPTSPPKSTTFTSGALKGVTTMAALRRQPRPQTMARGVVGGEATAS
jgi:hypothetical protein